MVDQSFDWPAFQRLDNAAVVDFLTSTASALCEKGLISAKDTDNLRLILSGINSTPSTRERPLVLELDRQNAEFLAILTARFGGVGLCLNLIRHTLKGNLSDTRRLIADLGQGLVKKSELLFNRPFFIFHGGRCQKQTLYSTMIIDFSETLAHACDMLERALADLSLMNPSDMAVSTAADVEVDLVIAKALGFTGLLSHSLPIHAEMELKRMVSQALAQVADVAMEVSEQLTANTGAESGYEVVAACEWLKAECQRLGLLEFPQSDSLMAWEVRRRNLSACVSSINEALRHVAEASLKSLGQEPTVRVTRLPESAKRRVAFELMTAGITPPKAVEATEALFRYLIDNKLSAKQIIVGELARIHASLLPRSLETLVALEGGAAVMAQSGTEKSTTMTRARLLAETFKRTLADHGTTLVLLAAIVISSGCGLKTRPQSEVIEPRPDIPFRSEPAKPVDAPARPNETLVVPPATTAPAPVSPTAPTLGTTPDGQSQP